MEQRVYNLIKSMVNIDAMVKDGYDAASILGVIKRAFNRQKRECPFSEMDIAAVIKFIEESEFQPVLPNRDVEEYKQHQGKMDADYKDYGDEGYGDEGYGDEEIIYL